MRRTNKGLYRAILLTIVVGVSSWGALPAMAQAIAQERQRVLTVTGEGKATLPATIAQINLGVEISGSNAAQVQQQVAARTAAVVELLRSRRVENLQTQGITLQPRYDFSNNQQRLVGYVGSNTVSFRLPAAQAGTVLDAAVGQGATRIDGISFVGEDAAIAQARERALQEAVRDARQEAEVVLQTLGFGVQEVVGIQIGGAERPPIPLAAEAASFRRDAVTPVLGGEQTVQARVTLQIRY